MEQIYFNGDIVTMEEEQDSPEAVLVRDGKIVAVGLLTELEGQIKNKNCERIDLEGRTLMPSFIDGHGHFMVTAEHTTLADLSEAHSFVDMIMILKEFQKKYNLTHGEPIFGVGYDHNFLREQIHPTRNVLDEVSRENPVGVWHASHHMGSANSMLLSIMGIDENTKDPEGGKIGRYAGSRKPNGYLEEAAIHPLRLFQKAIETDYRKQIDETQQIYAKHGVTTVQDGAANRASVEICRAMGKENKLYLDVVVYPFLNDENYTATVDANTDCLKKYVDHVKINGMKIVLDGSPQARSAWMSKPYEGSKDYCGYPRVLPDWVTEAASICVDRNLQLLAHCNGDAASELFLDSYEEALEKSTNPDKKKLRPVMIHCQTVRNDQLDRMAKMKMIPSIFVSHVNYWGDVHLKNFGEERGRRVSPVKSALDRKLIYNFHTDTPIVPPNIFHAVWSAVNRITKDGVLLGPEERVSAYDALKGVTINAAYEYSEEDRKGSIKKGKLADLIIVDQNPLKVDPMKIKDIKVLKTIKEGQIIYENS